MSQAWYYAKSKERLGLRLERAAPGTGSQAAVRSWRPWASPSRPAHVRVRTAQPPLAAVEKQRLDLEGKALAHKQARLEQAGRQQTLAREPADDEDHDDDELPPYPADAKPVFVGHYWLKGPYPKLLRRNIACVDWSVPRGGFLCAYRWDGERELDAEKFV